MPGYCIGSHFFGSDSIQTSTANQEIIQQHKPSGQTYDIHCYKFSFYNDQACTIKVNDESSIYLRAKQGFNSTEVDQSIYTFVIVEAGITYNYLGAF